MSVVSGVLSVGCLAVALLHLVRLVRPTSDDHGGCSPIGELSHAVMALGMAAMFSPVTDPLPPPVWTLAFLLCGAWFVAVAVGTRSPGGDAAHHIVCSAAMLFMVSAHHGQPAPAGDHAGHGGGGGEGIVPLVAIVLAGYFGWHALRCTDRLRACAAGSERAVDGAGTTALAQRVRLVPVSSPQTVALAHLVMAGAMTAMLLAMI